MLDAAIRPQVTAFCALYRRITGNPDFDAARCWFFEIFSPAYLYVSTPVTFDHPDGGETKSADFYHRLQRHCTENALRTIGLLPK